MTGKIYVAVLCVAWVGMIARGYAEPSIGAAALPGPHADPPIACYDGTYYIYPTTDGFKSWNSSSFCCWSSKDLTGWKNEGVMLDFEQDLTWATSKAWAPCIAYHRFRIPGGTGYNREVCIAPLRWDKDRSIRPVNVFEPAETATTLKPEK